MVHARLGLMQTSDLISVDEVQVVRCFRFPRFLEIFPPLFGAAAEAWDSNYRWKTSCRIRLSSFYISTYFPPNIDCEKLARKLLEFCSFLHVVLYRKESSTFYENKKLHLIQHFPARFSSVFRVNFQKYMWILLKYALLLLDLTTRLCLSPSRSMHLWGLSHISFHRSYYHENNID